MLPACRRKYPLTRVRWPGPPSPHHHLGLAPDLVVLFLQTDLGGPDAKARKAGPRKGPRDGGGYSSAAGRPVESVKAVPPPEQPPPFAGVRWVSRQGVPGGTLPRVPGRGRCAGRRAAPMPVPGRSAPQTTRLHQRDS